MNRRLSARELGKLEVGWWIAHNEGDRPKMLKLLIKQHQLFFSLPKIKTLKALKTLVSATKDHDVKDWKAAKKKVEKYYKLIKKGSGLGFNPKKAAALEVGWWKMHDELEGLLDKSKLAKIFTSLYSEILSINRDKLIKAGNLKAQATHEHDLAEDSNTSRENVQKHWKKAENLLIDFYTELGANS